MRRLLLLLLPFILLAGCRTLPPPETLKRPLDPEQASFSLSGRISVKHDGKRDSSGLYWSHTAERDEISLLAPLGQTVARIVRNADGATLETSDDKRYTADSIGELTFRVFGWAMPVEGLPYWIFALPAPGSEADSETGANEQMAVLRQDGWEIRYSRYASGAPDSLPMRMTLVRDGLEIQLLVDEWEIL
jgi:outer membrane lipoprotein LolB